MLLELYVENFILIDSAQIPFKEGLNIMTGETGAGKSIVLNAINLILGGQASKDFIKSGKDKAIISGTFLIDSESTRALLVENGLDSEDDILTITREITQSGKSSTRLNGRLYPLSLLKSIGSDLIDIHGQHEHQSLLKIGNHLKIMDQLDKKILDLKGSIKASVETISRLDEEINQLRMDPEERNRQLDLLNYQIEEIHTAQLTDGEDEKVEKRLKLVSEFSDIINTMGKFQNFLDDGQIMSILNTMMGDIQRFTELDDQLKGIHSSINDAYYIFEDVNREISDYITSVEIDEEEHHFLITRLDTINDLKRKFGSSIEEITAYQEKLNNELEKITKLDETIDGLIKRRNSQEYAYKKNAEKLSTIRNTVRKQFVKSINNELQTLNMKNASFDIKKEYLDRIHTNGYDSYEFMISTNAGEPLRSLKKVVSGGELSRLMLSIKVIIGQVDQFPSMIFDEVDAGISGQTASIVGQKLKAISKNAQVICVTHLANIAVYADHHLFIAKNTDNKNTFTSIRTIDGDDVVNEISRLISGDHMTDISKSNAIEMLKNANI